MNKFALSTSARLAAAILGLSFLTGCGGQADGTTSETAVQSTQQQSDAWSKLKAEGKMGNADPGGRKKPASPFGHYGSNRR